MCSSRKLISVKEKKFKKNKIKILVLQKLPYLTIHIRVRIIRLHFFIEPLNDLLDLNNISKVTLATQANNKQILRRDTTVHFVRLQSLHKKATIQQVITMLATSKNVLCPCHNHLLTTSANDLTL